MIQAVIFSMDRAMQLDSLLRSMEDMCTGLHKIKVIYRATSPLHGYAYSRLWEDPRKIPTFCVQEWDKQGVTLANELNKVIRNAPENSYVCINVDDQVYFRPADFKLAVQLTQKKDAFLWSWRLGSQQQNHWFCENSSDRDYGYLWHSDGALYRREDYLRVLDGAAKENETEWSKQPNLTPNHLETIGAVHPHLWRNRRHVGPALPCCMTWQVNKERTTAGKFGAPWVTVPETQFDVMAQAFLDGKRVQNDLLYKDLSWTTRFQLPDSIPTHVRACEEASRFYASLIQ